MFVQNTTKHLDDRDIILIYYSWEIIAPDLYEISLHFFNELYSYDSKNIPSTRIDINTFSLKTLNTIGYIISNLEDLQWVRHNLNSMLFSLNSYGKLESFDSLNLKKAMTTAIKKSYGNSWNRGCGMAWLKLVNYIEKEIIAQKEETLA